MRPRYLQQSIYALTAQWYISAFMLQGAAFALSGDETMRQGTWRGLLKYKENIVKDWCYCAALWLPLNYINFKYVPTHWRLPFVSGTGLIWVGILSFVRGDECDTT